MPVSFDLNYRSALWPPDQAAACGAFAVAVPGDWEGLPTRDELAAPRRPPRHRAPLRP